MSDPRFTTGQILFSDQDQKRISKKRESLNQQALNRQRRRRLSRQINLENETIGMALEEIGFSDDTVHLLTLVPLIFVAWSDGTVTKKERDRVFEIARSHGMLRTEKATDFLAALLLERPANEFFDEALKIIRRIYDKVPRDLDGLAQDNLVELCAYIAEASGGFLGIGSKTSEEERKAIDIIARTLNLARPDISVKIYQAIKPR